MLEHARLLFLEEWFLSVLALLLLFALGYGAWWLNRKRKRPSRGGMKHEPLPQESAPDRETARAASFAQEDAKAADDAQLDRLTKALEATFAAGQEEHPQPATPEPGKEVASMVQEALKGLDSFGLTFKKMRVFNDPNASLQQISQAITSDLVFSGKVLKTANSPYFGAPAEVSSLHHAVLVLGLNNLKTLYFQDHFRMVGQETGRMSRVREKVWKHSISTAILASYLCKAFRLVPPETAFTLGLLHDLGKLALADMVEQLEATGDDFHDFGPDWTVEQEQQNLGVDHAWIGRMAAVSWNLPQDVAMVIGAHHCMQLDASPPPSDSAKAQLVTLVLADHMAHALLEPEKPAPPLPTAMADKLHNTARLQQLVRDPKLLEELQLARVLP